MNKQIIFSIVMFILLFVIFFIIMYSPTTEKFNTENNLSVNNSQVTLKTVNYNIFGRWFGLSGYEGQDERLKAIPEAIYKNPKLGPDVDVITINEAWCPDNTVVSGGVVCGSNKSRQILIESMNNYGWKYHTDVLQESGITLSKHTSGGCMIFSKWPIDTTSQYVYDSCADDDCNAAKGVVYARITKTEPVKQVFNIFTTHLQAWNTEKGITARKNQLKELYDNFLPHIGIPMDGTEPIIYQGDMNTDSIIYPEQVSNMKQSLHATSPVLIGDQKYSSDPRTNMLVGKDGAAKANNCLLPYENNIMNNVKSKCKHGDGDCYCDCCPLEFLDYILYNNETGKYLQPTSSTMEIIPLKAVKPLNYKWGWCEGGGCIINKKESENLKSNDLSDHYPVVSNFVFEPVTDTFKLLDGPKDDSDCTFSYGYCYCTGKGCTLNNVHVDGWKLGHSNPVNDNCHFNKTKMQCYNRPGNR